MATKKSNKKNPPLPEPAGTVITNCIFNGPHVGGPSLEKLAEAAKANAEAIRAIAEAHNANGAAMIKIGG